MPLVYRPRTGRRGLDARRNKSAVKLTPRATPPRVSAFRELAPKPCRCAGLRELAADRAAVVGKCLAVLGAQGHPDLPPGRRDRAHLLSVGAGVPCPTRAAPPPAGARKSHQLAEQLNAPRPPGRRVISYQLL